MGTLHTINKSPFTHNALFSCLKICRNGDAILLIENGVLAGIYSSPSIETFLQLVNDGVKIYALENDVSARGLQNKTHPEITLIDYSGFVQLSIKHPRILSWY
jgi:tRNA 2-thiouridine synthesizing protein B